MNKLNNNAVIILAKRPIEGKIKSRVAKATSDRFAKELAIASFEDLLNNISHSNYYDLITGSDSLEDLEWFENRYGVSGIVIPTSKADESLTSRMEYAFDHLINFMKYQKVLLIPMDMPFIDSDELITAFARLDSYKYILGPEKNGGIYLIGMRNDGYRSGLFDGVAWSTEQSYETLSSKINNDLNFRLKIKQDLNTFPEILSSRERIRLSCPKLFDLLSQNGYYLSDEGRYVDFDTLNISISTVSVIIEKNNPEKEILIQTRAKNAVDPIYSGKFEIPSGLIERYENPIMAGIREINEETGLFVGIKNFLHHIKEHKGSNNDTVIEYDPFLVTQQTRGGRSYVNLTFICRINDNIEKLRENPFETKDPHWIKINELRDLVAERTNEIFLLNLPALKKYIEKYSNET